VIVVVIATGEDGDGLLVSLIDHAVLVVDFAGPPTGHISAQLLRLTDAVERFALTLLHQRIDSFQRLFVS